MANTSINITTTQAPGTDPSFSEQKVNSNTGPTPVMPPNTSLETNAVQPVKVQDAAIWVPMTQFEDDLKGALKAFIDTTKEGVKYAPNFKGRTKIMEFFFSGTATKSVRPSEVGYFRLIFSYPPNISGTVNTSSTPTGTQTQ